MKAKPILDEPARTLAARYKFEDKKFKFITYDVNNPIGNRPIKA